MTQRMQRKSMSSYRRWLGIGLFGGLFLLLLFDAETAARAVKKGLALCVNAAIPSLFPFMVASELLTKSGLSRAVGHKIGRPFSRLFSLPSEAGGCFLFGMLCGFPIGARTALSLYDEGVLSDKQTERLLCFCNLPSSAFLIGTVGTTLYGDRRFGIFLYGVGIVGSLLTGLLLRRQDETKHKVSACAGSVKPNAAAFTDAVSSATSAMLLVIAYILFFSAVIGVVEHLLDIAHVPLAIGTFVCGILELTSGTGMAAALENRAMGMVLAAFFVGFGGLSVHLQLFSFCGSRKLSKMPYLTAKVLQGIFCAVASLLLLPHFPCGEKKEENITVFFPIREYPKSMRVTLTVFLLCLVFYIFIHLWQAVDAQRK